MNRWPQRIRERGGGLGISLLLAAITAESVALSVIVVRAENRVAAVEAVAAARLDSIRRVQESIGRPMPAVRLPVLGGDTVDVRAIAETRPTAFWIFSARQCLICFAESGDWAAFHRKHPDVAVVAIASGPNRSAVDAFWQDENLEFPVLYDSASSVLQALGARDSSTVRLFVRGGRIALIAPGDKPTALGLPGQLDLLYSSGNP